MILIDADELWMDTIRNIDCCSDVLDVIERQSTVNPVKHGHWETEVRTNRDGTRTCFYVCSLCGKLSLDVFKYCPNCGGRNEVDENDCY